MTTSAAKGVQATVCPIGPDKTAYNGSRYLIDAFTWNLYYVHTLLFTFIPAVNEFNAKHQICAWVSADPTLKIPETDAAIRQQCNAAGGKLFFSGKSAKYNFEIPRSSQLSFSTGFGDGVDGGTAFTPQGYLYIVPLRGEDDTAWDYGTTTLVFDTTFSSPGTANFTSAAMPPPPSVNDPWVHDKWFKYASLDFMRNVWDGSDPKSTISIYNKNENTIYTFDPLPKDNNRLATWPAQDDVHFEASSFYFIGASLVNPPDANSPTHKSFDLDTTNNTWKPTTRVGGKPVYLTAPAHVTNGALPHLPFSMLQEQVLDLLARVNLANEKFEPLATQPVVLTNTESTPLTTITEEFKDPETGETNKVLSLASAVTNEYPVYIKDPSTGEFLPIKDGRLAVQTQPNITVSGTGTNSAVVIEGTSGGVPVSTDTGSSDTVGQVLDCALDAAAVII